MAPKPSRRSSKTSIVSVDPAVARHITGSAKASGATKVAHARTESTPARATAASDAPAKGHGRTSSAPNRNATKRSNSLRRAKNSTELLKLKSSNTDKNTKESAAVGVNRGRNFTVSNVGTGGLLHLSPSPRQASFTANAASTSPYSWMPLIARTPILPMPAESDPPPLPATARTRSVSPKRLLSRATVSKNPKELSSSHHRSQSFSTLDESRRSIAASLQPKTLKIVINRPDSIHTSEDEEALPTLEIPIPSYKLGTPRFSAHGTPFIQGSIHSRGSGVDTNNHTSMTDGIAGPPLSSLKAFSKLNHAQMSVGATTSLPSYSLQNKQTERQQPDSAMSVAAPITADLYHRLLRVYDDPAIVRYANKDRDIAAATKIRIIAQISSESFMDYDLVSDFFLTFRSYMTTFEVLDYLLARLKWSIARLSDDGRIIRIRTFAALRHWILNYFAEDFVVNRHLRVRFCEDVNALYESVRQRQTGAGGISDLKILQDLKRCWNGRCALYWDAEQFNMDSDQEEPLLPGGVLGSRNPAYADISEATAALGLGLQGMSDILSSPLLSTASHSTMQYQHKRLPSSEYAKKPLSIESAQSLQPKSCSLPRRSPNHDKEDPSKGPQPVSVLARRRNAPSDLKVQVDALGESNVEPLDLGKQTPVEALVNSGHYIDPHAGSMIRGFVYGPVEPFVQLPTNPPLSPSVRFSQEQQASPSSRASPSPSSPSYVHQGPVVKKIFGSVRRALSGKQSSTEVTLITVSTPQPSTSHASRRAPVPLNLARSNDDLRRKAAGVSTKTQLRIDLLCAAAVQSFQTVVPGTVDVTSTVSPQDAKSQHLQNALVSLPSSSPADARQMSQPARLTSHYTARSGSILIVDDTAVPMPVMSGALPDAYVHRSGQPDLSTSLPQASQHASFETQIAFESDESERSSILEHTPKMDTIARANALSVPASRAEIRPRTASAATVLKLKPSPILDELNKDAGYQAESLRSTSAPSLTEATSTSESPVSKAPAHGLRRRPGGDLRKNQNVHDLEPTFHHQSLDSMLESSSHASSLLIMGQPTAAAGPPRQRKKSQKVSMINTNSSQHLRPSFEAAISGFSTIADEDDGGLEATLLKLEGRYEGRSPNLSNPSMSPTAPSVAASFEQPISASTNPTDHDAAGPRGYVHGNDARLFGTSFFRDGKVDSNDDRTTSPRFAHRSVIFGLPTESQPGSESGESDVSLPILKRNTSIGRAITTDSPKYAAEVEKAGDQARSSSDVLETNSSAANEMARPSTTPTEGGRSFFLDEDENISDLSSEISVDVLAYTNEMGKPVSPMLAAPGTAISGLEIPSHPLTHASLVNLNLQTSPNLAEPGYMGQPLTPQQSPALGQGPNLAIPSSMHRVRSAERPTITAGPAHVPFILACESDILAQQLTIVEQSALREIEWTDLVEMRWSIDKSTSSLDWAEYMAKHDDARGVDVVAARFNLVTKWALSEIVLTQDIGERARVLSKFIHVAAHARRLHNYATMLQITFALMATSCSRLKKTWELVPNGDISVLKHMEKLAQPTRNFHDLRIEMESTDLTDGCIPFLGLYVRDLTYNANKPAEIQVGEGMETLINFERFRTAAIIIKGLLRLIDASQRYDFEPLHGVVERCLWLSALDDARLDALSKALE